MTKSKAAAPKRRPNGLQAQQISEMQKLSPRAAAWLAGVPASTLRDSVATLPPDDEGNYDARDIVSWSHARKLSAVSDDELELIHRAFDYYEMHYDPVPLASVIKKMREKYGRSADGWVVDLLLSNGEALSPYAPKELPPLSEQELLSRAKAAYDEERRKRDSRKLMIPCVCEECGRMRLGNKWVKKKLGPSETVLGGICGDCASFELQDPFTIQLKDLVTDIRQQRDPR